MMDQPQDPRNDEKRRNDVVQNLWSHQNEHTPNKGNGRLNNQSIRFHHKTRPINSDAFTGVPATKKNAPAPQCGVAALASCNTPATGPPQRLPATDTWLLVEFRLCTVSFFHNDRVVFLLDFIKVHRGLRKLHI